MTAYDLVRYRKGAGSIDLVATVLSELAERLDAKRLLTVAKMAREMPVIQRLGYLLERTGHAELAGNLAKLVERAKPRFVRLEPGSSEAVSDRNARWHVLVNTTTEVEARELDQPSGLVESCAVNRQRTGKYVRHSARGR